MLMGRLVVLVAVVLSACTGEPPAPTDATALPVIATPPANGQPTIVPTFVLAPTPTSTKTPISTPTPARTPPSAPTSTPVPTSSPPSAPTSTPIPTPSPTSTPRPAPTSTPIPTPSPTSTPRPAPTITPIPTSTPTPAPTSIPMPTSTPNGSACRLVERSAFWDVGGFAFDSNGQIGSSIGKVRWRPNFLFDWERGPVFGGRKDMLLLDATMSIAVSRPGWVWFEIGGDDGFVLFVNGEDVLDDWNDGSARRWGRYLWMQPGIYELTLRYYEWTDRAELLFNSSQDILNWYEAVGCEDSDRLKLSASTTGPVVYDGALLSNVDSGPRVVLLQGIDSEGSCEDVRTGWESLGNKRWKDGTLYRPPESFSDPSPSTTPSKDGMFMRRHTLVSVLRDKLYGDWEGGVLGFSYSGSYENCGGGRTFSADEYPLGDYRVFASYRPEDTCLGVRDAAASLDALLESLHAQEPEREIVLLGHSLGGMVAAYYMAEFAPHEIQSQIKSVITIDSPLFGYPQRNPFSACHPDAQSWQDILGVTDVTKSIKSIEGSLLARKFVHLNSTDIGDSLVGGDEVRLNCGKESAGDFTLLGGLIGTLVTGGLGGLIVGAAGGETYGTYGPGHSCAFYDPDALGVILDVVRQ